MSIVRKNDGDARNTELHPARLQDFRGDEAEVILGRK